jgi:hypothetical protein
MPNFDTIAHSSSTPFRKLWDGRHPKPHAAQYWTILPQKQRLYVFIERVDYSQDNRSVESAAAWVNRAAALRQLRQLPKERQLNSVTVILADDYEDHAGYSLLQDLVKLGQQKDVTVQSMIVPKTTEDVIAMFLPETSTN